MSEATTEKRTIKSEMVAERIREYIIENGLKPGDKLPTEGELTELYGVSRVSVREATKALSFLGIIEAAPRRGLTVGNFSVERVSKYLAFHFAVGDDGDVLAHGDWFEIVGGFDFVGVKALQIGHGWFLGLVK